MSLMSHIVLTLHVLGTAVFNSNCVFVYLFSIFLLRERVTVLKVLAVLVASGGVVCLAMAKTDNKAAAGSDTIVGPILCALAACLYAIYEVRRGMRGGREGERERGREVGEGRGGFRCAGTAGVCVHTTARSTAPRAERNEPAASNGPGHL